MSSKEMFCRYIGVDYSGAGKPTSSTRGLAVCAVDADGTHEFHSPTTTKAGHSNRRDLTEWLVKQIEKTDAPILVGIDHAFSFPIKYFEKYGLPQGEWHRFLTDFRCQWPTHKQAVKPLKKSHEKRWQEDNLRAEQDRKYDHRWGRPEWFRLTEECSPIAPASVFGFDPIVKQRQVATQTHAGLPWLLHMREKLDDAVHFWPFDGWDICPHKSVIAEVYPSLWSGRIKRVDGSGDQHSAYSVARWMWETDQAGLLRRCFRPGLPPEQCDVAQTEGWILGLVGPNWTDSGWLLRGCVVNQAPTTVQK